MLTFLRLKFQYKPLHPMKLCRISTFKSKFLTYEMCMSSSTSKIVQLDKVLLFSFLGEISIYKYHLWPQYKYHLWPRELFSMMPLLCGQPRSFWSNLILVFLLFSTVSAKVKSTENKNHTLTLKRAHPPHSNQKKEPGKVKPAKQLFLRDNKLKHNAAPLCYNFLVFSRNLGLLRLKNTNFVL